jgi:two-component system alkaline phosphatase synthesis response regulator PhoP
MKTFIETFMNEVKNTNKKKLTQEEIFELVWNCQKENNIVSSGDIVLDKNTYCFTQNGSEPKRLEKLLFNLLSYLINREGKVVDRDTLLKEVWGDDVIVCNRSIDVAICKIRNAVGVDKINTIKGVGYMFKNV